MIAAQLMAAMRMVRLTAWQHPRVFPAALHRANDVAEQLLMLPGEEAEPLRAIGRRCAVAVQHGLTGAIAPMACANEQRDAAIQLARLEHRLPPGATMPLPHWLPQVAGGAVRNVPFTVVQGGRP